MLAAKRVESAKEALQEVQLQRLEVECTLNRAGRTAERVGQATWDAYNPDLRRVKYFVPRNDFRDAAWLEYERAQAASRELSHEIIQLALDLKDIRQVEISV